MDTEEKRNSSTSSDNTASASKTEVSHTPSWTTSTQAGSYPARSQADDPAGQLPDMMAMLEQCAVPSPICGWLRCLRAPGMELTYSMEKRHIPDMDMEKQKARGGRSATASKAGPAAVTGASTGNAANSDTQPETMQCAGTCRVRYFDLAVGAVIALTVGCMLKCMMGCCRCIKKKF